MAALHSSLLWMPLQGLRQHIATATQGHNMLRPLLDNVKMRLLNRCGFAFSAASMSNFRRLDKLALLLAVLFLHFPRGRHDLTFLL